MSFVSCAEQVETIVYNGDNNIVMVGICHAGFIIQLDVMKLIIHSMNVYLASRVYSADQ